MRWNLVRNLDLREIDWNGRTPMTYKRADVHILRTARVCSDQRISKRLDELVGLDWRPAHSASNGQNGGKVNSTYICGWLVSPGVRSTYIGDGAVLLNVKEGLCYSLNGVAAQVWVTIAGSPAGVSLEGVVDVLETHFAVSREELERDTSDCLAELELTGLVQEKVVIER